MCRSHRAGGASTGWKQEGLIQGRVALLDREALGMEVVVFATVNLTSYRPPEPAGVRAAISCCHAEVVECYTMTGHLGLYAENR